MKNKLSLFLLIVLTISSFGWTTGQKKGASKIQQMEEELLVLINKERLKYNLEGLKGWNVLSDVARSHSNNMATGEVEFGHGGFESRAKYVKKHGAIQSFAENVGFCNNMKNPLQVIVKKWMESPGHRANILDNFEFSGIAIVFDQKGAIYFTQLFARNFKHTQTN